MAAGVLILAFFGSRLRVSYRTPLTGCARDHGTGGASGLFRWADRIGIPAQLLEVPIWEVSQPLGESSGNCVLTMGNGSWSPTGEDLEPANWQSTRDWLSRGNTLIVATSSPRNLPPALRQDLIPSSLHETAAEPASFAAEPASFIGQEFVDSRPETSRAPVTSGGILTVETKGPRWSVSSTPGPGPVASEKNPPPIAQDMDPARWQLAGDQRGGVLFRIPVGQGAVYVLLDEFAWTNTGLDQGDNARVLAELLGREIRGGVLALDEYRHGHGRTESFLTFLFNLPGSSALMWLAAIWAILYFYARNVRLKPVEAYVERERRTAQEYIDAVAQLYERARAAPLVVEAVARRLRQVSRSSAEHSASVEVLLQTAEDYTKAEERPASPIAAINLVKELIQLRKRIYGTRTVS
jgi:hypothetical protein